MNIHTPDIFTRDIIQNSLQAIADEMFAAMRKAAMSPIIYEVLDMGTGITDARGEIASSGAGIPAFVGVLDKAVKKILLEHSPEEIDEGDVFISNDPHDGQHCALERCRRHGSGVTLHPSRRYFPRGLALDVGQDDQSGAPHSLCAADFAGQLTHARLYGR